MKLTHYGHACVLVETDSARILIDPGTLSTGFEGLRGLDAVLITHDHDDHLDLSRILELLAENPDALVLADPVSAESIGGRAVAAGDVIEAAGSTIEVLGRTHAPVYDDFPGSPNVAYLIDGGAFFHPGDSFEVPGQQVDVLGLPIGAPWLKLADAIDYLRRIRPRVAVPIHEVGWAHLDTAHFMIGHFAPDGTAFTPVERGVVSDFSPGD